MAAKPPPCRSPAERVRQGEDEHGSGRRSRRQAGPKANGLCEDEVMLDNALTIADNVADMKLKG